VARCNRMSCFNERCWTCHRLLRWQLSRNSGTTTTSRTPTIITDERQLFAASKGARPWLELAAALPHTCLYARTDVPSPILTGRPIGRRHGGRRLPNNVRSAR
jgi:hypothetical protein